MDFSTWSPSHTIFVIFVVVGFIGQIAVNFYRTGQLEKRMDRMGDELRQQGQRLEDRIDKRIEEVNQRLSSVEVSLRQLNQNHIDHLNRHNELKRDPP